jgi:DNA-directed RNA polymerase subunit M/transcription elongation factor TFIIS
MPENDAPETVCPQCKKGSLQELKRIRHADSAVTIYLRCAGCSHIEVVREQAGVQGRP